MTELIWTTCFFSKSRAFKSIERSQIEDWFGYLKHGLHDVPYYTTLGKNAIVQFKLFFIVRIRQSTARLNIRTSLNQ